MPLDTIPEIAPRIDTSPLQDQIVNSGLKLPVGTKFVCKEKPDFSILVAADESGNPFFQTEHKETKINKGEDGSIVWGENKDLGFQLVNPLNTWKIEAPLKDQRYPFYELARGDFQGGISLFEAVKKRETLVRQVDALTEFARGVHAINLPRENGDPVIVPINNGYELGLYQRSSEPDYVKFGTHLGENNDSNALFSIHLDSNALALKSSDTKDIELVFDQFKPPESSITTKESQLPPILVQYQDIIFTAEDPSNPLAAVLNYMKAREASYIALPKLPDFTASGELKIVYGDDESSTTATYRLAGANEPRVDLNSIFAAEKPDKTIWSEQDLATLHENINAQRNTELLAKTREARIKILQSLKADVDPVGRQDLDKIDQAIKTRELINNPNSPSWSVLGYFEDFSSDQSHPYVELYFRQGNTVYSVNFADPKNLEGLQITKFVGENGEPQDASDPITKFNLWKTLSSRGLVLPRNQETKFILKSESESPPFQDALATNIFRTNSQGGVDHITWVIQDESLQIFKNQEELSVDSDEYKIQQMVYEKLRSDPEQYLQVDKPGIYTTKTVGEAGSQGKIDELYEIAYNTLSRDKANKYLEKHNIKDPGNKIMSHLVDAQMRWFGYGIDANAVAYIQAHIDTTPGSPPQCHLELVFRDPRAPGQENAQVYYKQELDANILNGKSALQSDDLYESLFFSTLRSQNAWFMNSDELAAFSQKALNNAPSGVFVGLSKIDGEGFKVVIRRNNAPDVNGNVNPPDNLEFVREIDQWKIVQSETNTSTNTVEGRRYLIKKPKKVEIRKPLNEIVFPQQKPTSRNQLTQFASGVFRFIKRNNQPEEIFDPNQLKVAELVSLLNSLSTTSLPSPLTEPEIRIVEEVLNASIKLKNSL